MFMRLEVGLVLSFSELDTSYAAPASAAYFIPAFSDRFGLCKASGPSTGVVTFSLPETGGPNYPKLLLAVGRASVFIPRSAEPRREASPSMHTPPTSSSEEASSN